jgi:hypothetical protein
MAFQVPRVLSIPIEFDAAGHLIQMYCECMYVVNMPRVCGVYPVSLQSGP